MQVYLFAVSCLVTSTYCRPQYEPAFHLEPSVQDPKTPVRITLLPFYGGAKGQTLQITETADGSVTTSIIHTPLDSVKPEDYVYELENPELPAPSESPYTQHIKAIQNNALNILKLQEHAKRSGLSERDENVYRDNVRDLNQSAVSLAEMYELDEEGRAGLSAWFERKKTSNKTTSSKDKEAKKKEEERKKKEDEAKRKKEQEEERKRKEVEKKKKEEEEKRKEVNKEKEGEREEEEEEEGEDSVAVNLPGDDASVAEAKPIGLAVAGIGGVAASKPIATAVVGPGGLAVARPVGTAIAGVSPDQALVPIYAEGYVIPSKPKDDKKTVHTTDYLNKIIEKYHQF